jgi:GT2 family glycosyltransferase/glycosyltransferase involved in cell wall biosynthesis
MKIKSQPNNQTTDNFSSLEWLTNEAVSKHKSGQSKEAVIYYLELIKLASQSPAWIYGNAITLLAKIDRLDEALNLSNKALDIHLISDEIYRAIGIVYDKKNDISNSINYYRQAIRLNSNQPEWVYYHLTDLLTQQNFLEEAIEIGQQGIQYHSESHLLHYYFGETFAAQNEWEQAIAAYIRSLELKSDFKEASYKLDLALEHRQSKSDQTTKKQIVSPGDNQPEVLTTTNTLTQSQINNSEDAIGTIIVRITEIGLGGILSGWAIDKNAPNEHLQLKISVDGKFIQTVKTNTVLTELAIEHSTFCPKGFKVQLPVQILDEQEHLFELLPLNQTQQQSISLLMTVPRCSVGILDWNKGRRIRGWALPEGHIAESAKLDVYINDIFYTEIKANLSRPDLLKQGLGNGKNGFDLTLPFPSISKQQYKVAIVYGGTQQHLKRSPLVIEPELEEPIKDKNLILARITEVGLGGILYGWAIDNANPDHSIKLKVIADGQPIAVVETQEVCSQITDECLISNPKKFQVQLSLDLLDGQEHLFELVPISKTQKNLQSISTRIVVPRRGFGVIDGWSNNRLRGWVLPDDHVSSPAILDVYIDGIFYKEIKANLLRRDLIKHGIGKGENGFEIALPLPPEQKTSYEVEIFFHGTKQHLKRSPTIINFDPNELKNADFGKFSQLYGTPKSNLQGITIIIPVFNAYAAVRQCLDSVFKYTSIEAKLIIINDDSTDERMQPMLEMAVANRPNVQLITNEKNLGYTATINKGINLASEDDVVLLNSDTSVGPRWLQNLRVAAYHDLDIGTVTAISDNSGAFSVPSMGQANDFPVWLQPEEIIRVISSHSKIIYPETPTGSGFCLYIRRELLTDIGLFDQEAFPRGYGEENDFCMRAIRAGWRHIVDDRTLVYHVRSASFQGEKQALYKPGREVVDQRYPEYKALVNHFVHSPQMDLMRYQVRKLLENSYRLGKIRPRVLFVISTKTGGTPQTNQDLMNGLGQRYHPMLLICDSKEISLYDAQEDEHILCEQIKLRSPINPTAHISREYDNIVGDILLRYNIELVHIRHIAWHSTSLARLAKRLDIPTILSFHDFYTICPTVNLLDENLTFCGGECTATQGRCPIPIWAEYNLVNLKHDFIKTWQRNMAQMFQYVDAFVTTAPSAKAMMTKIYPELDQANFQVIPHGRDFPHLKTEPTFVVRPPKVNQPLRILFPGNISSSKGAELIVAIKELDRDNRLEFHFLGRTRHFLKSVGILHGTYTRADFDQWIQKIRPHCVSIFSIWPETYCHTLTESWASGIPVVAINKGAVGERISRHGGGWLIDEVEPKVIYQRLLEIADDVPGYIERISHLNQWQLTYAKQNNIATMAAQYHKLYQQVISATRPFELPQAHKYLRVGVFINQQLPPTAHIRVLEWLQHPQICDRLDFQMLDIDVFLNDKNQMFELDVVLIQRNIIQPHNVQFLIDTCRQRNLPIVYEIDDNLLNVPQDKDSKGVYAKAAPAIKALATAASKVIVSTDLLAKQMSQFNDSVTVIPNVISELTWLKPVETSELFPQQLSNIGTETLKILYMGNSSHVEDLAMIKPVFESLYAENFDVRLLVIGCEPEVEENAPDWYTRLSIPQGYDAYEKFVPWFRQIAQKCDMAIAPLVGNEFNQFKSPLKFLQYSAVGLPAIYSNCTPYREVVIHGVNGILTNNDQKSWIEAISKCIGDRNKLSEIAKQAKTLILEQYLMSNYTDMYIKIFEQAIKN